MKTMVKLVISLAVFAQLAYSQIPTNGLVAYYPFNGNANDESGNGHHGAVNGPVLTTDRFSDADKAYWFDGINDYIQVPTSSAFNLLGDLTISTWVLSLAPYDLAPCIIAKRDIGDVFTWHLSLTYDHHYPNGDDYQKVFFGIRNDPSNYHIQFSSTSTSPAVWQHILVKVMNNVSYIYIDGVLDGSKPITTVRPSTNDPVDIGWNRYSNDERFKGKIDDIRIYNRALTASEIQQLQQEGLNHVPVAVCANVSASAGASCSAAVAIDNGSYDADGDPLTLTQNPAGPYPVGTTSVTLTAADNRGGSSTCTGYVTVVDDTPPTISCPLHIEVNPTSLSGVVVSYATPVGSDNCSGATTVQTAGLPSGSNFPIGTTTNTFVVTDASNNAVTCSFDVTVLDAMCGPTKVYMCHNDNTICVSVNSMAAHLAHGDLLGECEWYKRSDARAVAGNFDLGQNYPNPFNPSTRITYTLSETSATTLVVFDHLGREIATLVRDEALAAGTHTVVFDGARYPSGVYSYRLITESGSLTRSMVLLK